MAEITFGEAKVKAVGDLMREDERGDYKLPPPEKIR